MSAALAMKGTSAFVTGRWTEALACVMGARQLVANSEDAGWVITLSETTHSWTLFYLGEFRVLSSRVPALLADAVAKGNRFAANAQSAAFGIIGWLADDDVAGAERELTAAEQRWPKDRFQLSDYWFLLSRAFLALYKGEASGGHAYMVARWSALRRSQLLAQHITRQQLVQLRAQLALAAIAETDDRSMQRSLLADARRRARTLARTNVRGSTPLAELVRAAIPMRACSRC